MRVEVERVEPDRLTRQVWTFWVGTGYGIHDAVKLRLEDWQRQERRTPRHKWVKAGDGWKSRAHNGTVHYGGWTTPAADVPFPADVVEEAKAALMARIIPEGAYDPKDDGRYG